MSRSSNISRRRKSALSDGGVEYTAKRGELIQIAARLFRENGYQATRLIDIANVAGMDRASVYYYVGSKEELFRESVEGMLDANIAAAEKIVAEPSLAAGERIHRIGEMLMASYEDNFPQMYVYIQELMHQVANEESPWAQEIVRKTKRFETLFRDVIQQGINEGELRGDVPVLLVSNALFGMFNWTHRWFTPGGKLNARDVSDAFFTIFFAGMQNAAPAAARKSAKKKKSS